MSARSGRPGRQEIDRTHRALVRAVAATLRLADRVGPHFAGSLAAVLQDLNRAHSRGAWRLVDSRAGSWEAGQVTALAARIKTDRATRRYRGLANADATEMDWGM
jgi:hypothetical protein